MIFGTTEASSGDVRVVGPTDLSSVDCESFSAWGATNVEGDVEANQVSLKGSASVGGDVTADEFGAKGAVEVAGSVSADDLSANGATSVAGRIRVDHLDAKGANEFADVEADSASVSGTLAVDELRAHDAAVTRGVVSADAIRADEVRLALGDSESTVGSVVGETITVARGQSRADSARLVADEIDGEVVDLEHATVEEVVGEEVRLGPGARVEVVRAAELDVAGNATVGQRADLG